MKYLRNIPFILMLLTVTPVMAQSRLMPVTETAPAALSLSTGGTHLGQQTAAYIYTNPTAALDTVHHACPDVSHFAADYTFQLTPSSGPDMMLHAPSAALRVGPGVLLVGMRYLDMGTLTALYDADARKLMDESLHMYTYSLDAGYALPLTDHLKAAVTVGYAQEKTATRIHAYYATATVDYVNTLRLSARHPLHYRLGLQASNLGAYSYSGVSGSLSPRLAVGGSARMQTVRNQYLHLYAEAAYFVKAGRAPASSEFCGGIGYTVFGHYSVFVGEHTGDGDPAVTTGLQAVVAPFTLGIAARWATAKDQNNTFVATLGIRL